MPIVIYEDTRQQRGKHAAKHEWWDAHGVSLVRRKLDFGDYMLDGSNVSVDTKASVDELARNVSTEHERFRRECQRAYRAGHRLVVLVENREGYTRAGDLCRWMAGHCLRCGTRARSGCMPMSPGGKCARHGTGKPMQGARLYRACETMQNRYGVRFEFCAPDESARRICELLGVGYA